MSSITEAVLGNRSTPMTDGAPTMIGHDERGHAPLEEARLARLQAEEAVQRVQHRIERLAHLSEASDRLRGGSDGQERSKRELAPTSRSSA